MRVPGMVTAASNKTPSCHYLTERIYLLVLESLDGPRLEQRLQSPAGVGLGLYSSALLLSSLELSDTTIHELSM